MRYFLAIIILIYLTSCTQEQEGKLSEKSEMEDDTVQQELVRTQDFKFGPDTSIIEGTLEMEEQFGPPGYGEDPENDMKEKLFFLYLETPVNVYAVDSVSDSFDVSTKGVDRIQLNSPDIDLNPYNKMKIKLKGVFFGAFTRHHHTDVLMDVKQVN